jgi:hypothetical protein
VIRLALVIALLASGSPAGGQVSPPDEKREDPPSIQDNSFLLEEAYNQEEGVVQHVNAFQRMRGGEWIASFTQEWPVPRQAHQFSYTIPYQRVAVDNDERSGLSDIALNYRYQLAGSGDRSSRHERSVSLYLSFEHPMWRPR